MIYFYDHQQTICAERINFVQCSHLRELSTAERSRHHDHFGIVIRQSFLVHAIFDDYKC